MLSLCLSIEELNKSLMDVKEKLQHGPVGVCSSQAMDQIDSYIDLCATSVTLRVTIGIKRENTHLLEYPAAKVVSVGIGDTTEPIREVITSNMAEQMWKKTLDGCQSPEDMPKIVKEVCLSYDYKPTVKGMLMIAAESIVPAQDAVMRFLGRMAEVGVEPGAPIIGRLLVHLRQIGCLWGKGGMIIAEMRRVTGASIYIFPREHVAKYGMPSHEVVQPEIFVQTLPGCIGNMPCAGEPSALRELRLERKKAGDKALRKYTHKQFLQPSPNTPK
ncbi:KH domain-containing protein HEN4 isoform X1 [Tanacetum coccineum]